MAHTWVPYDKKVDQEFSLQICDYIIENFELSDFLYTYSPINKYTGTVCIASHSLGCNLEQSKVIEIYTREDKVTVTNPQVRESRGRWNFDVKDPNSFCISIISIIVLGSTLSMVKRHLKSGTPRGRFNSPENRHIWKSGLLKSEKRLKRALRKAHEERYDEQQQNR